MQTSLYDELSACEETHWWFVGRRRILRSLVQRYLPEVARHRKRICELGCGCGGNLAVWADAHDIQGVDCMPPALQYARQRFGDRVRFGRLPDELPVQRESVDVVLLADVLEHIEDDRASAQGALSLLRPGGILVATVPAYQWLYAPRDAQHHHFRRYAKRRFRGLFDLPDARVELLSHYNTLLFPPAMAARLASRLLPATSSEGDLRIPPKWINLALTSLFAGEAKWIPRSVLPFGLSLVAVVRKLDRQAQAQAA